MKCLERFLRPAVIGVRLQIELVSFVVRGWPLFNAMDFVWRKFRFELICYLLRQRALDCKRVGEITVVLLRPNVAVVDSVDQLNDEPHTIAGPSHTTSSTAETPNSCAIARMLWALARYCITDVREITLRSSILASEVSTSSWMPSAKCSLSLSSLKLSKGRTAIDLSSGGARECESRK